MDPVTALGVAAAAIQFVSFTSDFVEGTIKLYNSDDGQDAWSADVASNVQHIEDILQSLRWSPEANPSSSNSNKLEAKLATVIAECHAVYNDLDALLRTTRVTASKHGRAIESVRVKWRTTRQKHDIERLYDKLKQLRGHTDSCAIMILSSNGRDLHTAILDLAQNTRSAALTSTWELTKLRRTISDGLESTHTVSQATHTLIDELARETRMHQRLSAFMQDLRFPEMNSRFDRIEQAESYTFEWLFADNPSGYSSRGNDTSPCRFMSWLQSDHCLYWITGVPGCGKSTLMKYIASHKKTAQGLRHWAGPGARVIVASCYFWSSGSDLQKSQEGLLRTLLATITMELPHHVEIACPARFANKTETGSNSWSTSELTQILDSVIESTAKTDGNIRFCFFVDGLDEYTGDHNAIARFIKRLSQKSHVKVCVSSRELNTFVYHFALQQSRGNNDANAGTASYQAKKEEAQILQVHRYTRSDIFRYVRDKLDSDIQPVSFSIASHDLIDMVSRICERSQGVFLWVHLVCQDILRGYVNGDSWDDILAQIDSTPTGLEPYFDKMMKDIDPKYSAETAMILITCLNSGGERKRNKLVHTKIGKAHWDGGVAEVWGALYDGATEEHMSAEHIKAACGSILNVNETSAHFIHRTARDFVANRAEMLTKVLQRHDLDCRLYDYRPIVYKLGLDAKLDGFYLHFFVSGLLKYEETTGKADAVFLDGLDEFLDGMCITDRLWKTGDTLKLSLAEGLAIYASTALAGPGGIIIEPVTAMNGISLPLITTHLLPWLDRKFALSDNNKPHAGATITAQSALWAALGWREFKMTRAQSVNLSPDISCLQCIQPHGMPSSAPIHPNSSIFTSTISQVWLHYLCNELPNFGTGHETTAVCAPRDFAYMMENSDCCDHFFDERTDLSAEPAMRKVQRSRRCKLFLGLFPGPSALAAHWHCYMRGWLFILYICIIGREDFNIEPRSLIVKTFPEGTHKSKRKQPSPTTPYYHGEVLEWGDFLPLELYDFCDIMWPSTWLVMSIGIVIVISRVFTTVSWLFHLVMQLFGVRPSSASTAQVHTYFRLGLTCCYLVSWALYAKAAVYWRCRIKVRLEYLIAREVSRTFVKKLAVYYFASFWVLWFFWRQLSGLYSSFPVGMLLPTFCFISYLYMYM